MYTSTIKENLKKQLRMAQNKTKKKKEKKKRESQFFHSRAHRIDSMKHSELGPQGLVIG